MYIILYIYVVWYLLDLVLRPLRAESLMVSQWCVQEECVLEDMLPTCTCMHVGCAPLPQPLPVWW